MFGEPAKNIPFFICFVLSVVHLCGTAAETIPLKNIFGIIKTSLLWREMIDLFCLCDLLM